ncbi:unnamed protein product [Amoebophrya sp. A25]|nr:unnamed protein product [Amoebophrya sp. A25]|eukprot:GSA25T00026134001.1
MLLDNVSFGPNVVETDTELRAKYTYDSTEIVATTTTDGETKYSVLPKQDKYEFVTDKRVPKMGVMLVGWGGNNGSTVTAGIIANKKGITWRTKTGVQKPNYYGSLTQASTIRVGNFESEECYVPFNKLLPMVHPNDLVLGGWDISGLSLDRAMERAGVLDVDLQNKVAPYMSELKPLPAIFDPSFVAENQQARATNVMTAKSKEAQIAQIREDVRKFKADNDLDTVVVMWTANTERYSDVGPHNQTLDALMASVRANHAEISPSTLYAIACIEEGVPFINGSPQNTFVPGVIELAEKRGSMIGGDDFKSGQTKMKSVLTDFLVSAGIKPRAIVSYNHLGNNDGMNLSNPLCFKSKEISKSDVVNDMIHSNELLYDLKRGKKTGAAVLSSSRSPPLHEKSSKTTTKVEEEDNYKNRTPATRSSSRESTPVIPKTTSSGNSTSVLVSPVTTTSEEVDDEVDSEPEHPDHCVVIKYIPYVGDSKRAMDEYSSEIFLGGVNTIVMHNTCEDSLLAAPLILDLVLLAEMTSRIRIKREGQDKEPQPLHPVNVLLSYLTKAPLVPKKHPCINALAKQRAMLENVFKACVGLPPDNNMWLESKFA